MYSDGDIVRLPFEYNQKLASYDCGYLWKLCEARKIYYWSVHAHAQFEGVYL